MPQRLPSVLSSNDLPIAELSAARLDGEVFRVDACFAPVDEIEQPIHRAQALRAILPEQLIAEQRSAAWVWGALERAPRRHEMCVPAGVRTRSPGIAWLSIREVVIEAAELVTISDLKLTTPLRTVIDIARFSATFGQAEEQVLVWLMRHHRFGIPDCLDDIDRRRNLPRKRQAIARLTGLAGQALPAPAN